MGELHRSNLSTKKIEEFLEIWVEYYYVVDFMDAITGKQMWSFVHSKAPWLNAPLHQIAASWYNKHWESMRTFDPDLTAMHVPSRIDIMEEDPVDIARQLSLIEFSIFEQIDIFSSICTEKPSSPMITRLVKRFNIMSDWLTSEVLSAAKVKRRAAIITHFISIAKCCFDIRNYNAVFEIIAGLDSTAISPTRLKKTWKWVKTNRKIYNTYLHLSTFIQPSPNYENYRSIVKDSKRPCMPFFGVVSRDITMINVGNESVINNQVNFEKCSLLWEA